MPDELGKGGETRGLGAVDVALAAVVADLAIADPFAGVAAALRAAGFPALVDVLFDPDSARMTTAQAGVLSHYAGATDPMRARRTADPATRTCLDRGWLDATDGPHRITRAGLLALARAVTAEVARAPGQPE